MHCKHVVRASLLILLLNFTLSANINAIHFEKIDGISKLNGDIQYLIENQSLFDHWSSVWVYPVPKEEVVKRLESIYSDLEQLSNENNPELFLLLGTIAHYLYNLDKTDFFDKSVLNFKKCEEIDSSDYRIFWFLGNLYAQSMSPGKAMQNFFRAESLLSTPGNTLLFWKDYAQASYFAGMIRHTIYATRKAYRISRHPDLPEIFSLDSLKKKLIQPDINGTYEFRDLWKGVKGKLSSFVSYPLGIKFEIDSTWKLNLTRYQNRQAAIIISPNPAKLQDGTEVGYTIAILTRVPKQEERLEDFMQPFLAGKHWKKISFSQRYDHLLAYECKEPGLYPQLGGGYLYLIGIRRDVPKFPGLSIEIPIDFSHLAPEQYYLFSMKKQLDRFNSRIFYIIILDTCKKIHAISFNTFKNFFNNQLKIE